ncbi:MAG TPA: hypothetical protein VF532_23625 [Candidatus Angelobacter sp.]
MFLIPLATRLGVAQASVRRMPIAAAFAGVALGIAVNVAPTARQLAIAFLGMIALGATLWVCGVFVGGLMFAADTTRDFADWAPVTGFVLGVMLGLLPLYATVRDAIRRKKG